MRVCAYDCARVYVCMYDMLRFALRREEVTVYPQSATANLDSVVYEFAFILRQSAAALLHRLNQIRPNGILDSSRPLQRRRLI